MTAIWAGQTGEWRLGPQRVLTGSILFLTVEPAPPTLVLTQMEKILRVNATYQLPPCMPWLDLKYEVEFWKEGVGRKVGEPVLSRVGSPPHFSHCFLHFPPGSLPRRPDSSQPLKVCNSHGLCDRNVLPRRSSTGHFALHGTGLNCTKVFNLILEVVGLASERGGAQAQECVHLSVLVPIHKCVFIWQPQGISISHFPLFFPRQGVPM